MATFLPLVSDETSSLFNALNKIGPVLYDAQRSSAPSAEHAYLLLSGKVPVDLQTAASWLDQGVEKLIAPLDSMKNFIDAIDSDRLILLLDVANVSTVSEKVRNGVSGVLLKTPSIDLEFLSSVSKFFAGRAIYALSTANTVPTPGNIRELRSIGATLVIPDGQLTLEASSSSQVNVAEAFLAPIVSDRPDGLFPTVVSSQTGHTLGLVYSSHESLKESIVTGKGVYQSRKHGLWRKGETSGATQDVLSIRLDCDSDAVEFRVVQHGAGFCHLNRQSCFVESSGLPALEATLASRLASAPEGSYTKRLFTDAELLRAKIMEEANELCDATEKDDIAFEAADLLYFALVKCASAGVSIANIERSLDLKARRVSRRPGNAKPQWVQPKATAPTPAPAAAPKPVPTSQTIQMRTADLVKCTPKERTELLCRPVLKSDEMISKVRPIVEAVRTQGDKALLELTEKFDKVKLSSTVIFPPFGPETMQIEKAVKEAIDVAYANVYKFHDAQMDKSTLVVETMPGVTCSRFARPIARVGLYIPGGTAILPSTALMLGIPAQVAGCKQIVFATPPRPDGSISPEVMYVASLVGASAILKAGGAQAVAALAYGTATVPKVDKIFGPGNQWVTAAKMLVQNDTEALVSIDMPAGPSEVLVSHSNWT